MYHTHTCQCSPVHFSRRLSVVRRFNHGGDSIRCGKFISHHIVLLDHIRFVVYHRRHFAGYRSERVYDKSRCLRLDGAKLSLLRNVLNAVLCLHFGNCLFIYTTTYKYIMHCLFYVHTASCLARRKNVRKIAVHVHVYVCGILDSLVYAN